MSSKAEAVQVLGMRTGILVSAMRTECRRLEPPPKSRRACRVYARRRRHLPRQGPAWCRGEPRPVEGDVGDLGLRSASAAIENCRTAALGVHVAHCESLRFGDISVPGQDRMDNFSESSQLAKLGS